MTKKVATTAGQSIAISGPLKLDNKTDNESVTATPSAMASTPQLTVTHEEMHLAVNEAVAKALLEAKLHTSPRIVNDTTKEERTWAQKFRQDYEVSITVEKERTEAQKTTQAAVKEAVNAAVQKQQIEMKKSLQGAVNHAVSISAQKQRAEAQKTTQAAITYAVDSAVQKQEAAVQKTTQAAIKGAVNTAIYKQRAETEKTTQAAIKGAVNIAIYKQRAEIEEATQSSTKEAIDAAIQKASVEMQAAMETLMNDAVNAAILKERETTQKTFAQLAISCKDVILGSHIAVESATKAAKEMADEQVRKQMEDFKTMFTADVMDTVRAELADQKMDIEDEMKDLKDVKEALKKTRVMAKEAKEQVAAISIEATQAAFKETIAATFTEMKERDAEKADLEQALEDCNDSLLELEKDHRTCPHIRHALREEVSELKEKIKAMETQHEKERDTLSESIFLDGYEVGALKIKFAEAKNELELKTRENGQLIGAAKCDATVLEQNKKCIQTLTEELDALHSQRITLLRLIPSEVKAEFPDTRVGISYDSDGYDISDG